MIKIIIHGEHENVSEEEENTAQMIIRIKNVNNQIVYDVYKNTADKRGQTSNEITIMNVIFKYMKIIYISVIQNKLRKRHEKNKNT